MDSLIFTDSLRGHPAARAVIPIEYQTGLPRFYIGNGGLCVSLLFFRLSPDTGESVAVYPARYRLDFAMPAALVGFRDLSFDEARESVDFSAPIAVIDTGGRWADETGARRAALSDAMDSVLRAFYERDKPVHDAVSGYEERFQELFPRYAELTDMGAPK